MNIFWVSGKCGYGKTAFAKSIIEKFERKGKKTCKLDGQDFIDLFVKNIKIRNPIDNLISRFQEYDLLVLDDLDLSLSGKRATQKELKKVIQKITDNNKTKVILISQKRARKIRNLKFNSNCCEYIRLKAPSADFKIQLAGEWLEKEKLAIPEDKIKEIIDKSNNLFQLKGLLNQISFLAKYTKRHNVIKCS